MANVFHHECHGDAFSTVMESRKVYTGARELPFHTCLPNAAPQCTINYGVEVVAINTFPYRYQYGRFRPQITSLL